MQSTRQSALVSAGGDDLSSREMRLYRRRRRGAHLSPYQHRWLNALWPDQIDALERIARGLDQSDREMRRARRNGITVVDAGRVLPPAASPTLARPQARRRGAGRPRATASRSSARSGDSGDDGEGPEAEAARLRGFLLYLIGFDWSEALIDRACRASIKIERGLVS